MYSSFCDRRNLDKEIVREKHNEVSYQCKIIVYFKEEKGIGEVFNESRN